MDEVKSYDSTKEMVVDLEKDFKKDELRDFILKVFPKGYANYNSYHILLHPWEILFEWKRQIKWAWQRVFRGWDDRVIWSIDFYLAENLPIWLNRLKETSHGVPSCMFQDEDYIDENWNTTDNTMQLRLKEYHDILDKISYGFQEYNKIDNIYEKDDRIKKQEEFEESFDLLKKYFGTLWD